MLMIKHYQIATEEAEWKRTTKQREAIREVFVNEGRPLGPSEVHELVQRKCPPWELPPSIERSRNLRGRLAVPVAVAGTTRYERADLGHHHHFHCHSCDKTFDIKGCVGDLTQMVPEAFRILSHELTIMECVKTATQVQYHHEMESIWGSQVGLECWPCLSLARFGMGPGD